MVRADTAGITAKHFEALKLLSQKKPWMETWVMKTASQEHEIIVKVAKELHLLEE